MHGGIEDWRLRRGIVRGWIGIGPLIGIALLVASATGIAAQPRAAATPAAGAVRTHISVYFLRPFAPNADIPPFAVVAAAKRSDRPPPDTEPEVIASYALSALVAGPNDVERQAGMATNLSAGLELAAGPVVDGVATVEAPAAFFAGETDAEIPLRLAQVVFTLTAIPTIDQVRFLGADGQPPIAAIGTDLANPLGRDDFVSQTPPILVESPTPGEAVSSPVHVHGTANTFEGAFYLQIVQEVDGQEVILAETPAQTTGSGTRGAFGVFVAFPAGAAGPAALATFQIAPSGDGTIIDRVEIPVMLTP